MVSQMLFIIMKKLVVLLFLVATSMLLNAQTNYVVCYDNVTVHTTTELNGPVSGELKKNEVVKVLGTTGDWAIIDRNGSVAYVLKYFLQQVEAQKPAVQTSVTAANECQNTSVSSVPAETPAVTAAPLTENSLMTRSGRTFYCGERSYSEIEMYDFLRNNCKEAYEYYRSAQSLEMDGIWCFTWGCIVGIGLGVPIFFWASMAAGAVLMGAGNGLLIASIPIWCVGAYRINNTPNVYNQYCVKRTAYNESRTPKVGLQFQRSLDGIGFAVTF